MATPSSTKLDALKSAIRGDVLTPGAAGYDAARTIWNAMIDRRPAVIARCKDATDVPHAIRFAREHHLPLSIRGGGHNIAGSAVCDDGLMIDLSPMKTVRVDAGAKRAIVDPGATLADFDREAQAAGLATPLGINSTTGVAGLTLGGGFGWLTRKYGLTVDNLVSATMVTADGQVVRASAKDNPELFWALRGGGGNFGVVTAFEYGLHQVGPDVLAGLIVFPFDQARDVFNRYREFVAKAPDELALWAVLRKAPPLPFLSADVHGKEVMVLAFCYTGDAATGDQLLAAIKKLGTPVGEHTGRMPYAAWQQAFDPLLTPGARNYWKSHNFQSLQDGLIDTIMDSVGKLPSPHCEIFVGQLGGQANRVSPDATAYPHRDAEFVANVHGRWERPEEDEAGIKWSRAFYAASAPFATSGVYVNFMTGDEGDVTRAAFGPNYNRLVKVKDQYDPENVFRMNHNVRPSAAGAASARK